MWNIRPSQAASTAPAQEPLSREPVQPISSIESAARNQSSLGKSWVIKGDITGSEPLFIDCRVEGSINLPGELVTIGRNAHITATISAADIVVLGTVNGDVIATNRLEIRAQGVVKGNVTATRLSIEDGAWFKGGVNTLHGEAESAEKTAAAPARGTIRIRQARPPKAENLPLLPVPMSA
jgi:cytoskeletal protein CcmA (bactofilin family)